MEASAQVVLRRIRNRVIEYLEGVAMAEVDVPMVKTADIVNDWEFYVNTSSPQFPVPPFSDEEAAELGRFGEAWERFCEATPEWPETYDSLFAHPAWSLFRDAAASALATLRVRGRLSED